MPRKDNAVAAPPPAGRTLPLIGLIAACAVAAGAILHWSSGNGIFFVANLLLLLTEGGLALVVLVAAGGLAWPLAARLGGDQTPLALRLVTACALGLAAMALLVLAVGTVSYDLLRPRLWWPLIVLGAVLAGWYVHKHWNQVRLPAFVPSRDLVWVLAAVAVGLWLSGVIRPPGLMATEESYDVLEYHLQLPREFYNAQHIGPTQHNVYGHYPLGVEMLFLLGMILRGGAYEGMYLAQILHGLFGAAAVWAVASCLTGQKLRGRLSALLLATAPLALSLSWLAMVELAQVFYVALALLWLRQWLRDGQWTAAVAVGLMLGGSCGVKYLSVGLAAGPVLLAMFVAGLLRRRQDLWHVLLTAAACGLLFAPWLMRNALRTGNPVFPLASSLLGQGHWDEQSEQRWRDGHGPGFKPPVPVPPGWTAPEYPSRLQMLYRNFVASAAFGPTFLLLAAVGGGLVIARGRRSDPWDWALLIVVLSQLAVWAALTHGMPTRFLAPALAPLALLAGGLLAMIGGPAAQAEPGPAPVPAPASPASAASPAALPGKKDAGWLLMYGLLLLNGGLGLFASLQLFVRTDAMQGRGLAVEGRDIAENMSPFAYAHRIAPRFRLLLIGEARAFYFPANSIYATPFDAHVLDRLASRTSDPREIVHELRGLGVTHLYVAWGELLRLANTYGYPAVLSHDAVRRHQANQPPGLEILDRLEPHGVKLLKHVLDTPGGETPTTQTTTLPAGQWPVASIYVIQD